MIPQIKKILYATDLSRNSSYAFRYATDLARKYDAKIVILHAVESVPPYINVYSGVLVDLKEKGQAEMVEEIKGHLQDFSVH
jgi:nucleotide-binding universal stress UspA family protein